MQYEFTAELWQWESRADAWTFVSVPDELSAEIASVAAALPARGFRSIRVEVGIGGSTWRTSMFPGSGGVYSLPVKRAVRAAEHLEAGDLAEVSITLLDL